MPLMLSRFSISIPSLSPILSLLYVLLLPLYLCVYYFFDLPLLRGLFTRSTNYPAKAAPAPAYPSPFQTPNLSNNSKMPRPRWTLQAEAIMWRNLMDIGMRLHCLASPSAPSPSFTQVIPSTISSVKGNIPLQFYVPESYAKGGTPNSQRGKSDSSTSHLYPIVINFHGGGFTIGKATDDARWARAVVEYTEAVVVSVDYRLAPEHPFPTAIEDGVDAALYLIEHAEELRLDRDRIAFSGFSAGGNMAFSVPIRLKEEYRLRGWVRDEENGNGDKEEEGNGKGVTAKMEALSVSEQSSSNSSATSSSITSGTSTSIPPLGTVVAISSWYPAIDYSTSREERRKTNVRSDKELPKFFTDLFDASYLHPPTSVDVRSPWLSPGIAPARMIRELPENIVIYACEWDALCAETVRFYERLVGEEFLVEEKGEGLVDEVVDGNGDGSSVRERKSKFKVVFKKVMGACHAFDKTPNPFNWDPKIETMYRDACKEMREVFYGVVGDEEVRRVREEEQQGQQGEGTGGGQKGSVMPRVEVTRLPYSDESLARVGSK
ncbi:hypothetical protein D9758_007696 [Tetrapyrgos nigripes]|uniref:Alpha/beta hydrolase fold-3 domain-containing protein n=1 Tax=Tetrapyrgos nigripes TaxID=182062 RepID=A0A8H5G597_9AGAR|nr:hypothetical protein D9758_007696 [Tetrapyrgos nigripes]